MAEGPYLRPSEVADRLGLPRREVIEFAMARQIPIYQGRLSWPAFLERREPPDPKAEGLTA